MAGGSRAASNNQIKADDLSAPYLNKGKSVMVSSGGGNQQLFQDDASLSAFGGGGNILSGGVEMRAERSSISP